jgi:putative DNA primase/helicase
VIVLDTLARCFIGGDENSAKDMGLFVEGCRRLQQETGATVIAIHHAGKPKNARSGPTERGSSALRAASDAVIVQKKKDHIVTVVNDKQKDDEEAPEIRLRLERVDLGIDDKTRRPITSCVLVPMDVGMAVSADMNVGISNKSEHLALERLADLKQASAGEWRKWIGDSAQRPVADRTFQHWRESLVERGFVEKVDESQHVYRCTEKGLAAARAAKGTPPVAVGDPSPASHAITPLGGGKEAEGQAVSKGHGPEPPGGPEL